MIVTSDDMKLYNLSFGELKATTPWTIPRSHAPVISFSKDGRFVLATGWNVKPELYEMRLPGLDRLTTEVVYQHEYKPPPSSIFIYLKDGRFGGPTDELVIAFSTEIGVGSHIYIWNRDNAELVHSITSDSFSCSFLNFDIRWSSLYPADIMLAINSKFPGAVDTTFLDIWTIPPGRVLPISDQDVDTIYQ